MMNPNRIKELWGLATAGSSHQVANTPDFYIEKFAELVQNEQPSECKDVRDFQTKFGQLVYDRPGHLTGRKATERLEFIFEEFTELAMGFGFLMKVNGYLLTTSSFKDGDITFMECDIQEIDEQADALVDLVYVIKGTATMMGLPWDLLWDDVQRANMAKEVGVGKRGHLVDCVKPEGWVPPQTMPILIAAGYRPDVEGLKKNYRDDKVHRGVNNASQNSEV